MKAKSSRNVSGAPQKSPQVHRIVLTGGPCAGKSTALKSVSSHFKALGFDVYCVPEAATLFFGSGVNLAAMTPGEAEGVQQELVKTVMALEDSFLRIAAATGRPSLLICDRGAMDGAAYVHPLTWERIIRKNGWSTVALRDERYDAVIHLTTAADGAEEHYTTANNQARLETAEEARGVDKLTQAAWVGHPHLRVIDNSTDFGRKMARVNEAISRVVGIPAAVEIERKYLLAPDSPLFGWPVESAEVEISQTYLTPVAGWDSRRVRRRGWFGEYIYTLTKKRAGRDAIEREEVEHRISEDAYRVLLEEADPGREPIRKTRRLFVWENQYFELDVFHFEGGRRLQTLEIELDSPDQEVRLPPFLKIVREVTDEPEYGNHALARRLA